MAFIYKITNLINNKIYIGETTRTIDIRWKEHKRESLTEGHGYNYHIHSAIRKYGEENFKIEQIEQCDDEARFAREHYFILFYNSQEPNGYNFLVSGEGSTKVPIESILELWNEGLSVNEISNSLGINRQTISNHLKSNNISQEEILNRKNFKGKENNSIPVLQYSLSGEFIREWPSASSVIKNNYSQTAISSVCRQEQITAYGYLWKYKNDNRNISEWIDKANNKKSGGKPKKPIYQLDSNYNILNEYSSGAEAAKAMGLKDKSNICAAARKGRKCCGYYWKYKT